MPNSRFPVELKPLSESTENSQFEADIHRMFQDLVEEYIRPTERDLNVGAVPHLGSFDLVSRHVELDGLALINNDDEPAMRYLYKAWKANNPKRGTHFLRTYLQLLFPDRYKVRQLYHPHDGLENYPAGADLKHRMSGPSFLTNRLRVGIYNATYDKTYIDRIEPAIRTILPARLLLDMHPFVPMNTGFGMGNLISTRQKKSDKANLKHVPVRSINSPVKAASFARTAVRSSKQNVRLSEPDPRKNKSTLNTASLSTTSQRMSKNNARLKAAPLKKEVSIMAIGDLVNMSQRYVAAESPKLSLSPKDSAVIRASCLTSSVLSLRKTSSPSVSLSIKKTATASISSILSIRGNMTIRY